MGTAFLLLELCVLGGRARLEGEAGTTVFDAASLRCEFESEGENEWIDGWGSIVVDG